MESRLEQLEKRFEGLHQRVTALQGQPSPSSVPVPAASAPAVAAKLKSNAAAASSFAVPSAAAAAAASAPAPALAQGASGDALRSTIGTLQDVFTSAIKQAFGIDVPALMAVCAGGAAKGHYQCNSAMSIFAKLKGQKDAPKNPKLTGDAIVANLPAHPMILKTEVAGPGFINIWLRDEFLTSFMSNLLAQGKIPAPIQPRRLRCVVDFSSPNIAKEMHGAFDDYHISG
jgi:hypothetical protein